jgi:hypothetical protein
MKLTKLKLKELIRESMYSNPNIGGSNAWQGPNQGEYIRNYKNGNPPENNNKMPYEGRPSYETGPVETHIKDGEVYVTQGRNQFHLVFTNEELTAGYLEPIGRHEFHITNGVIDWHDQTPANVRNDADLEQQILDYSGREG